MIRTKAQKRRAMQARNQRRNRAMEFDIEIDDDQIWQRIFEDYDTADIMDQIISKKSVSEILDNLPEEEIKNWYEENVVEKI